MILLLACLAAPPPPTGAALRVLSLHDTTTEMVVLLGREGSLVGVTEPHFLSPAAALKVQSIARLPSGAVNSEAILALAPDLVLGTDVVSERQPALAAELNTLGIPTLFVDPKGLDGLWQTMALLGQRLDAEQAAQSWVAQAQAGLPTPPNSGEAAVRVFLYDCCDPPFTAGGSAPISELLTRMGAVNVFADQDRDWVTVSWEAVAQASPELVIVHDYDWEGQAGAQAKVQELSAHPLLAGSPAARSGAYVVLPLALSLEGPRTLEAPALLQPAIDAAREAR